MRSSLFGGLYSEVFVLIDGTNCPNLRSGPMPDGRLIRITGDHCTTAEPRVAYIVAVHESAKAIDLIRNQVAAAGELVEDLGRVSEELLDALRIESGSFIRVDKRR
jgi:hypothetical protein